MHKNNHSIWDWMAKSFHHFSSRSKAHKDKYLTIAKMIINHNPKNILDLGCGSGLLEKELLNLGYDGEICAIDSSQEMLKIAKTLCGDLVEFRQDDLEIGLNTNKKFDVIVAINVLLFLKDKKIFLSNIRELLRDDKSIFILVNPKPNHRSNNLQFIKAHYSDTTLFEKIMITINEIINLPHYIKMVRGQSYVFKMADKGLIKIEERDEICLLANSAGLNINSANSIHANQNWLFIASRIRL